VPRKKKKMRDVE
jgi:hypothetical protein